ncbi:hypothetical protein LEN26_011455 [Aphanomyces euteiches]|nr:hypothetical protein LEN26_011455 [Aphanomyces euteiches]
MILTFASNDGNRLSLMNMRSTTLAFQDMVAMGVHSHESLDRMVVGMYMHSKDEFIAAVAQVPELELHEHQYVKLSFAFPSAEIGAKFTSAIFRPSFEAAMTNEERNDPRFQEALILAWRSVTAKRSTTIILRCIKRQLGRTSMPA